MTKPLSAVCPACALAAMSVAERDAAFIEAMPDDETCPRCGGPLTGLTLTVTPPASPTTEADPRRRHMRDRRTQRPH